MSNNPLRKIHIGNGAATNSIILMAVQIMTTAIGLVVTKLLSVKFSLLDYGTYSQALLVTSTASSISILGLTNATNYFYNKFEDKDKKHTYVSTIFTIQYIAGLLCALIIVIFRNQIAGYFGNDRLNSILLFVAFTPLFQNLIAMFQVLFVSIGKAKILAVRNLIVAIIRLITVVIACYVIQDIVTVLIVVLVLDILQYFYFYFVFDRYDQRLKIKDSKFNFVSEIFKFSIPMSIFVMTNSLSRDIDKYVVSLFSNTESLAIYSNAAKLLPFDMLTSSIITVLIPIVTRFINSNKHKEARDAFVIYLRLGFILTCTFVGGAISLAKYLMLFLYDEKYLAGISIFIIYLFIDMIRFANVTTILSGAGKTAILMRISIATLIANAILNVIAYKLIGMLGPAVVTLVLTIIMTIMMLHYGSKEIHCRIIDLFEWREILIVGIEIICFCFATHILAALLMSIIGINSIVLIVSYLLYLAVMFLINYKRILTLLRKLNQYK